ncbi:MAG: hypothetical protein NT031_08390, partial [Planctomycetota bacterium]|nr:hypothetical protein [Planctomycetota bacterium]
TNWNNWDGAFLAGPVDSTGAAVTSGLSVGLDLAWGGGWSYYYEYGRVCSATTNSLGRTGWNAQYGPIITLANIPYTNYTVATLVNNGYGTDELSWQVETGQTASSYRTPSYQNGGGSMCAIQIINTG